MGVIEIGCGILTETKATRTGKVEECLKMTQDINSAYHFLTVVGYSKN